MNDGAFDHMALFTFHSNIQAFHIQPIRSSGQFGGCWSLLFSCLAGCIFFCRELPSWGIHQPCDLTWLIWPFFHIHVWQLIFLASSYHPSSLQFLDWLQLHLGWGGLRPDWSWLSQCYWSIIKSLVELWSWPWEGKLISAILALYSILLWSLQTGATSTAFNFSTSYHSLASTEKAASCEVNKDLFCASTFKLAEMVWNQHVK